MNRTPFDLAIERGARDCGRSGGDRPRIHVPVIETAALDHHLGVPAAERYGLGLEQRLRRSAAISLGGRVAEADRT